MQRYGGYTCGPVSQNSLTPPPPFPQTGGACSFYECSGAKTTCDGGGCKFFQHLETLKLGYCNGENCFYNGRPHPHFIGGYLSY